MRELWWKTLAAACVAAAAMWVQPTALADGHGVASSAGSATTAGGANPGAVNPAGATAGGLKPGQAPALSNDQIDKMLAKMTPQQIEQLVKEARVTRLKVERQQVVAEIRQGLLYDPADVDKAVAIVTTKPADTQADNIDRICKAFAKVDVRFAKPYALYAAGQYGQAAAAFKEILDPGQSTYLSAAAHYLYAESLARSGDKEDAVEAYRDVLVNMPDRISFAAASALAAAQTYEQMKRYLYAMQMYAYCAKNYALTLSKAQAENILKKVQKWSQIYQDPLNSCAKMMGQVKGRLASVDSGPKTQKKEQEIIAVLDDLIKTAEDQQSSGQGQSQQRQRGKRPGQGHSQSQGQAVAQGQQGGQHPTSPMQNSMLVPGAVARPSKLSTIHDTRENGDWAQLPPREREKIVENIRKIMSERYRDIIRDYNTRLANQKPE